MPFKQVPQKFNAAIGAVTIGAGAKELTLGGENVYPLYSFDAPIEHRPAVGVEISDSGFYKGVKGIEAYYAGASTVVEIAQRAADMPGADFLAVALDGAHPDNGDRPVDECAALLKDIADAVPLPIVVLGSKNAEKDALLFNKISETLQGKNILVMSAKEENYKGIAAAAGLAYSQKISAESAVDINLAKQLNVLISQMGVKADGVVMNVGSAAAGYGFEYVASTMERVKGAALSQNDNMLQLPIVTPVSSEAWTVKESIVSEEDFPDWGTPEERGIHIEISTAAACLAAGSNAVILRHPQSVATISKLITELL
jgi:acetyl-CoA decarbonylase/synthase complex subunit delta